MHPAYCNSCVELFLREHANSLFGKKLNALHNRIEQLSGAAQLAVSREYNKLGVGGAAKWAETLPLILALRGNKPPEKLPQPRFGRVGF